MARSPIVFVLSRLEEMPRPYTHRPTSQGFAALQITGPLLANSSNDLADLQKHEVLRKRQMGQIRGEEPG